VISGKKQDIWYVIDLMTGEKQQTLTSSFAESLCPSTSLLYLGRTGHMLFFLQLRRKFVVVIVFKVQDRNK